MLRCALLIYYVPSTITFFLCYATPYGAREHPTDLRCTLLNYTASSELRYTLTEIPLYIKFVKNAGAGLSGIGSVWYRNEKKC